MPISPTHQHPKRAEQQHDEQRADVSDYPDSFSKAVKGWLNYPLQAEGAPGCASRSCARRQQRA